MNKPTARAYHHGDLADALIEATITLLGSKGPSQLSLREVARIAGVSHGAPAHHFKDKSGLLTAVAVKGHLLLAESLVASQTAQQSPRQRLHSAGEAYIYFAVRQPAYFSLMFHPGLINKNDEQYCAAAQRSGGVLQSCVEDLLPASREERLVSATVVALWSQVHGFATLWLAGNFGDAENVELLEALIGDMLSGINVNA